MTPPTHKTERLFRRYEPAINEILVQWPAAVIFDPTPWSIETFSCRLRDAIDSVLHYKWPNKLPSNLLDVAPFIIVSSSLIPDRVCAGSKAALKLLTDNPTANPGVVAPLTPLGLIITDPADAELVKAVIVLHHYRVLIEPTTLKTAIDVNNMAEGYDVFVEKNGDAWSIT